MLRYKRLEEEALHPSLARGNVRYTGLEEVFVGKGWLGSVELLLLSLRIIMSELQRVLLQDWI
ncbi:Uncharacterised protein [Chlamydia trachomatis]|nr:Uncharacterised protein [Chlamydia trachomatis]CRI73959.1 Uncharacterised protein [Chlamydia trachomatis]